MVGDFRFRMRAMAAQKGQDKFFMMGAYIRAILPSSFMIRILF